jgi:hypothetical protein
LRAKTFGGENVVKKPRLTLVPTKPYPTAPPPTLGAAGAKLWTRIQNEFRVDDAPGQEMLFRICGAADRLEEYAAIIAHDGTVIRTKSGIKDHPLLRHELMTRSYIVKSLRALGFDIEPPRDTVGRPPGTFNRG